MKLEGGPCQTLKCITMNPPEPPEAPPFSFKNYRTPLSPEFLKGYSQGRLVVDFTELRLTQRRPTNPPSYVGKGFLEVLTDSEFTLRMYVESSEGHEEATLRSLERETNEVRPGDFISPETYFRMSGSDISGFAWQCDRVQVSIHDGGHGIVLTGTLLEALKHETVDLSEVTRAQASMYFFNELRVALDRRMASEVSSGGRTVCPGFERTLTTFSAAGMEFAAEQVAPEKGSFVARLTSSDSTLPPAIETRVEETLRYVTASSANWCIVEKRFGTNRQVLVVPRRPVHTSFFNEPVDHTAPGASPHYWRLFGAYLEHVLRAKDADSYHPLSSQLFHVVSGETRQLDLNGLAVGVAVEGVLNVAFDEIGKPSKEFLAAREALATRVARMKCAVPELERRVKGALDAMKSSSASPTDKLKTLEAAGVVTREFVKQWKDLRNKTAHAKGSFDPDAMRKLFPLCNAVYTMLNRLVFQAIGYEGEFQDFSQRGWPRATFKPRSLSAPTAGAVREDPPTTKVFEKK